MGTKFSVVIKECGNKYTSWTGKFVAASPNEAVSKLVKREWHCHAFFLRDNTKGGVFGQIVQRQQSNPGAYNCLTCTVSVLVRDEDNNIVL